MCFRDEEGFLSEWVAYYEMHGFDHVMLFDDGSTDSSLAEVEPWIRSGFVSVYSNWTVASLNVSSAFTRNEFKKAMTVKALLERECKLQALRWGYLYFVSLDIDEYLVPNKEGETIVDELDNWFKSTKRSVYCIAKKNFQQSPHTLEPVNLLTIEAYQTRMPVISKMNYYMSVAPKCAYRLSGSDYRANSSEFIATCCHFHGCQGYDFIENSAFCTENHKNETWQLNGKGKPYFDFLEIYHYSRSIEKYAIKSKTWRTATGEVKQGETAAQAAKSYDIPKFLSRNVGWSLDRKAALRYGCQLRLHLMHRTNEWPYLRPGDSWYRNAEFGKNVNDPDKRGRYGNYLLFFFFF